MTTSIFLRCGVIASVFACTAFCASCDRTVETTSKTTQGPDGTSVKTETTVQHPDGTVTVDKDSKSSAPK
jgi:hypothetical protein